MNMVLILPQVSSTGASFDVFPGGQHPITAHAKGQVGVLYTQRKARTSIQLQSTSKLILDICSRSNDN